MYICIHVYMYIYSIHVYMCVIVHRCLPHLPHFSLSLILPQPPSGGVGGEDEVSALTQVLLHGFSSIIQEARASLFYMVKTTPQPFIQHNSKGVEAERMCCAVWWARMRRATPCGGPSPRPSSRHTTTPRPHSTGATRD